MGVVLGPKRPAAPPSTARNRRPNSRKIRRWAASVEQHTPRKGPKRPARISATARSRRRGARLARSSSAQRMTPRANPSSTVRSHSAAQQGARRVPSSRPKPAVARASMTPPTPYYTKHPPRGALGRESFLHPSTGPLAGIHDDQLLRVPCCSSLAVRSPTETSRMTCGDGPASWHSISSQSTRCKITTTAPEGHPVTVVNATRGGDPVICSGCVGRMGLTAYDPNVIWDPTPLGWGNGQKEDSAAEKRERTEGGCERGRDESARSRKPLPGLYDIVLGAVPKKGKEGRGKQPNGGKRSRRVKEDDAQGLIARGTVAQGMQRGVAQKSRRVGRYGFGFH